MPEGWKRLIKINARRLGKPTKITRTGEKGVETRDENIEFY
jgi:hypothetical protein